MRNRICVVLTVALLTGSFLLCGTASANSWGLTGKLYQAVERSKTWDDYTTLSNQEGPFAVMQSRYHNALFFVDSQEHLHVYTTAAYQPEAKRKAPKLYWDGHYLTISYGDSEYYTFCEWDEGSGEYQLSEAVVNEFELTGIPGESGFSWRYQAMDDDHDIAAVWPEKIMLADLFRPVRGDVMIVIHCLISPRSGLKRSCSLISTLICSLIPWMKYAV